MFCLSKLGRWNALRDAAKSIACFLSLVLLAVTDASAGQSTIAWDPVQNSAVAGYMVYYGQASGSYTSKVDAGTQTTLAVTNLAEGSTYYYAATDYDASRTESGFSNEASSTVPYSAPVANFASNVTSGLAALSVTFTSTSSGNITGYSWNFGDGATGTAQNPSHSYGTAGAYTVSLSVTGPGGTNTSTKAGYINVSQPVAISPPIAGFTVDKTSGVAPLTVNFASTSTGSISSYNWTFGDGTSSTAQNPSYAYSAAGSYTVALTVTGSGGSNTMTKTNYIAVTAYVAAGNPGHGRKK